MLVQFTVEGTPAPGGSKDAFPFKRSDGSLGVRVKDAAPRNAEWRESVAVQASAAMEARDPFDGPIVVQAYFRLPMPKRPKSDRHIVRPDATKLWRAVEDALTGIVWHDDAQIVQQHIGKEYESEDCPPGVTVTVYSDSRSPGRACRSAGELNKGGQT